MQIKIGKISTKIGNMLVPVLNPGENFGKTKIISVALSYHPDYFAIEGDDSEIFDILAENDQYGHLIRINIEDLPDYQEDEYYFNVHWSGNGIPYELDNIHFPSNLNDWDMRYYGDGLPSRGIAIEEFAYYEESLESYLNMMEEVKDDEDGEYNSEFRAICDMVFHSQNIGELFANSRILFDYLEEYPEHDIEIKWEDSLKKRVYKLFIK